MASEVRFYNTGDSMNVFDFQMDVSEEKKAIEVLEQRLDPSWIKKRDTGFGKKLDYIEGARVIDILNRAFNYRWSFEIVASEIVQAEPYFNKKTNKVEEQGKYVQVLGKLTVPGMGVKMAFGSKAIIGKVSEQESIFKAAMTDALKKAATLFGVGKELYLGDEDVDETPSGGAWANARPVSAPPRKMPEFDPKDIEKMKELKASLGIDDNEKLKPLIKEWSGGQLTEPTDITPENIKTFIAFLEKRK